MAAMCLRLLIALQLQKDALGIYKRLAEEASLDPRVSTFADNTIGCRTLEGCESTSEGQADERIIPAITDLDVPLVMGSRLKEPIKAIQETARVSRDKKSVKERWKTKMVHEHLRS